MPKQQPNVNINHPHRKKKNRNRGDIVTYEIRVYSSTSSYSSDYELIATIRRDYRDIILDGGRIISLAKNEIEEYVRNIGMFGISIENPEDSFTYYPPNRIAKIEFGEVD